MNSVIHLQELARQVRAHTIELLREVPDEWLCWTPDGTSNHILWHAGHALWVQDVLCVEPLTGRSELPDGWPETFGSDCRPVHTTREWPQRQDVLELLDQQLIRLLDLFAAAGESLENLEPKTPGEWGLSRGVIHALHDEACHQGEMYLLLKLRRGGS